MHAAQASTLALCETSAGASESNGVVGIAKTGARVQGCEGAAVLRCWCLGAPNHAALGGAGEAIDNRRVEARSSRRRSVKDVNASCVQRS